MRTSSPLVRRLKVPIYSEVINEKKVMMKHYPIYLIL